MRRAVRSTSSTLHGAGTASSTGRTISSAVFMRSFLSTPALEDPGAALGPNLPRPRREDAPELLADEARDRGALREAVIARHGLEHLQLPLGGRERPDLLVRRHASPAFAVLYITYIVYKLDPTPGRSRCQAGGGR